MADLTTYEERILALGAERLAGMTAREIAAHVGCAANYATTVLGKAGLPYRRGRGGAPYGTRMGWSMTKAVREGMAQGFTARQIAAETGSTPGSVRALMCRVRKEGRV